tara:strand:- start:28185 stop:28868 length:684 start_codon:yes stop_codon:yes gene_type:complete
MNTLDKIKNINVEIFKLEEKKFEIDNVSSPFFVNFKYYVFFTLIFFCYYYYSLPSIFGLDTDNTVLYLHTLFICAICYMVIGGAFIFSSIGHKVQTFMRNKIGKDGESFFLSIIIVLCPIFNSILIFCFIKDFIYREERKYIKDEELIKKESDHLKKELCRLKKEKKKLERKVIEDSLLLSKVLKLNSKNKIRVDIENKIKKIYEKENIIERHIKECKLNNLEMENI